jgi:hypothetical protein
MGPNLDPGLQKLPFLTFLVCLKAINTSGICLTFWIMNIKYFSEHIFIKKISGKKLAKNLCRSGPGSGT